MQSLTGSTCRQAYNLYKSISIEGKAFKVTSQKREIDVKSPFKVDQGADKVLFLIQEGIILFTPNLNCFDPIRDAYEIACDIVPPTVDKWKSVVYQEVAISAKAQEVGLLNANNQACEITVDQLSAQVSFLSESFESMAKRGLYVIENGFKNCAWKSENRFLFETDFERCDISKWEDRIQLLIQDVIKVCEHGIPIGQDSLHSAINKNESGVYVVRYYGFDFYNSKPSATRDYAPYIFERILEPVIQLEFRDSKLKPHQLIMELTARCCTLFKTRIGLSPVQSAEM